MTACVATVNHICWNTSFPSDLELLQLQSDHTVQNHSILGLHHGKKSWNLNCFPCYYFLELGKLFSVSGDKYFSVFKRESVQSLHNTNTLRHAKRKFKKNQSTKLLKSVALCTCVHAHICYTAFPPDTSHTSANPRHVMQWWGNRQWLVCCFLCILRNGK